MDPRRGGAPHRPSRPRVLIAVEPKVLGDAIAAVLLEGAQDEIVVLPIGGSPVGFFDCALVTLDLRGLDAETVIRLPDTAGGGGIGMARTTGGGGPVDLPDMRSVLALLDEHCPTGVPRVSLVPGG